jgi:hypothetical protein
VYVVGGRPLIRCRYCRVVATLAESECRDATEHPERYTDRLLGTALRTAGTVSSGAPCR